MCSGGHGAFIFLLLFKAAPLGPYFLNFSQSWSISVSPFGLLKKDRETGVDLTATSKPSSRQADKQSPDTAEMLVSESEGLQGGSGRGGQPYLRPQTPIHHPWQLKLLSQPQADKGPSATLP